MRISHHRENFEQTVRAYSADLYRYSRWLCHDRHLAEDIVQEAFARAWKACSELLDLAHAKAGLITIVRNEFPRSYSCNRVETQALDSAYLPALPPVEHSLR